MIVGKQNIISWFESLNVPYWDLFPKGQTKGSPIARSSKDDELTIGESLDSLKHNLNIQQRGQFTLSAQTTKNMTAKGGFRADFEIPASEVEDKQASTPMPVVTGLPQNYEDLERLTDTKAAKIADKVRMEMKLERMEERMKDLEKENKSLEKQTHNGSNRLWEAINGIGVENVLKIFTPKPQGMAAAAPPVQGFPEAVAEPPETDTEYSIRLGKVLEIFQANDPEWLETLEMMADRINKDPSVIKMLKKFL